MQFMRRHYWWLVPLLVADALFFYWFFGVRRTFHTVPVDLRQAVVEPSAQASGIIYGYPTAQTNLAATDDGTVYMPTASGRVESALYGSVRTVSRSGRLMASFHEGIDIAPLQRDRAGRPRDTVMAVADGRVAYVNRVAGNSTYGIYVVLLHADFVGEIFTLYAHLDKLAEGVVADARVLRGQELGRMGNTASTGIPMARAHLHFEIGVVNNHAFAGWYRRQKLVPDHGVWHGWNLTGVDPLAVFGAGNPLPRFCLADYLAGLDPAFLLAVTVEQLPDYFSRYPRLWQGAAFTGGVMVMAVSEGGVPLWARMATAEEREALPSRNPVAVLKVDEEVLGRNGLRLVVQRGGVWSLGGQGQRWLEILLWARGV